MNTKKAVVILLTGLLGFYVGYAIAVAIMKGKAVNSCKNGEYSIKIGYKDYNYQSVVLESEVTYK